MPAGSRRLRSARMRSGDVELGLVAGGDGPLLGAAEARGLESLQPASQRATRRRRRQRARRARLPALASFTRRAAHGAVEVPEYARRLKAAIRPFRAVDCAFQRHQDAPARRRHPGADAARLAHPRFHRRSSAGLASDAPPLWACHRGDRHLARLWPKTPVASCPGFRSPFSTTPSIRPSSAPDGAWPTSTPWRVATGRAGVVRVGLVATYARWKGHDVFLKAVHQPLLCRPAARGSLLRRRRSHLRHGGLAVPRRGAAEHRPRARDRRIA